MSILDVPVELVDHPRYRVLERIGQGGMGAVYRAEHRRMERVVALKVINPRLMCQPGTLERFQQEVRAAARLHHPNIVHAYDADQASALHFLVMEYVEGQSLAELVHLRGPLPVNEACEYIRQAALGLQHAHEQGMVHRDIKPQNLMVTPAAAVKVLDFGLARLSRASECLALSDEASAGALTSAGAVMGTADYIAPEQGMDAHRVDIRADIYGLGCTLFFLLTGRPPFPGGSLTEKLARHATTNLPSLNALCPQAPAALALLLARMTAKDPAERPSTPAAVARELAPFSSPPSPSVFTARWRRRWLPAAVVALLAGLALLGALAFRHRDERKGFEPGTKGDGKHTEKVPPSPVMDEAAAIALIQQRGGRIRRDEQAPDRPVEVVTLEDTQVTDTDLIALAAFTELRHLHLARTSIGDAGLAHLAGMSQLTTLDLPQTSISNAGLAHLAGLTRLEVLELQGTAVGDAGLKHLAGLSQLRRLWLARTRVTNAGMNDVARLRRLTFLGLEETHVSDAGLQPLADLPELNILALFGVKDVGDEGMKHVARIRTLRSLDLLGTRVTDTGLKELAGLTSLTSLRIGGPGVTDTGIRALAGMTELQMLELARTAVSDEGLKEVASHRRLTDLNVGFAEKVTDAGVKELAGLPHLKTLALRGTGITDAALMELAACPNLEFLSVVRSAKVTPAGVARLQQARPRLTIQR